VKVIITSGGDMYHFYADDGRILTPPKELKPLLKDSYTAFLI
jgi:hypothetical protein